MTANDRGREVDASLPATRAAAVLVRLAGMASAALILVMLAIVAYAVVQRYLLRAPLLWGDELVGYLLVASIMLGAAEALRRGDHIAIDLLTSRAGPRLARALATWADLAVIVFVAVIGWSMWKSIVFAYGFGSYSSGHIAIETWIPQVPVLIGTGLLVLMAAARIVERLFGSGRR